MVAQTWLEDDSNYQERRVLVWGGPVQLEGILTIPQDAHAVVVIPYGRMGNREHGLNELAGAKIGGAEKSRPQLPRLKTRYNDPTRLRFS